MENRLIEITKELFAKWRCSVIDIACNLDHIHIYFEAPPQVRLSDFVNNYKTVSARLIRKEFETALEPYFWSRSYFISSISEVNDETIRRYIDSQGE